MTKRPKSHIVHFYTASVGFTSENAEVSRFDRSMNKVATVFRVKRCVFPSNPIRLFVEIEQVLSTRRKTKRISIFLDASTHFRRKFASESRSLCLQYACVSGGLYLR